MRATQVRRGIVGLAAVGLLLGSISPVAGADSEPDVFRTVLPNGLRAIVRERPDGDVVAVSVGIRGGSRDEPAATVGTAHFMEHMFFQGTPRRPDAGAVFRDTNTQGGWANAWTRVESINFKIVVPVDSLDLAIDVIADQMVNSLFEAAKVEKERQVVLEELNARLNSPSIQVADLFMQDVFGDHPASNRPIGNHETITESTREAIISFRDTHFVASNMAVAVVGDVRHEDVFPKLATAFERMRTGPAPVPNRAPAPPPVARSRTSSVRGQQARILLGGPTVGLESGDFYVHKVINALLGDAGRRLERSLIDEHALVSSASSFYMALTDVGVWAVGVETRPADIDAVIGMLKRELQMLRERPVEVAELEGAKAYLRGQRLLHQERSIDLAEQLADGEVLGTYVSTDVFLARIATVSPDDVQRVARAYVDPDRLTQVVLRP